MTLSGNARLPQEAKVPTIEQARQWYESKDPVHGFEHVMRVMRNARWLAEQLGADRELVEAAALLHDAQGAHPEHSQSRKSHEQASAAFARQVLQAEGWPAERIKAVCHCIEAHRFRSKVKPQTLEAQILFDADKLDVAGAFGLARTLGYAVQAGMPFYAEPSERFIQSGQPTEGEPHSAYHEYMFKLRHIPAQMYTEPGRKMAASRHRLQAAFFELLAAEAAGAG
jgi:uncharacterized protein